MIPAVYAFGLDPRSGPPLIFLTLPKVFAQMPAGRLFAALFFISVFFAGITSLINMLEVCGEALSRHLRLGRLPALLITGAIVFGAGLLIEYEPYLGRWMDVVTIYIVPIGALLGAVMIYWVLGMDSIGRELMTGRKKPLLHGFAFLAKYVYIFLAGAVVVCSFAIKGGIG